MPSIDPEALCIVKTLTSQGFTCYFAGGWVRDYLLGIESADIDLATDAPACVVMELFPKTVPIGLAFGIVLVVLQGKSFEVATFRSDVSYADGRRPTSVVFTDAKSDAMRRDFTINGLFFDPLRQEVIDYVGGQEDLKKRRLRAIGNPHLRIEEDRLRMLRAIRLSCKLGFVIEPETKEAIEAHARALFPSVAMERVMQELRKMCDHSTRVEAFSSLFSLGLFQEIFPMYVPLTPPLWKQKLLPLKRYPSSLPLIVYLRPFFSRDHLLALVCYAKLSNREKQVASFWIETEILLEHSSIDEYSWVQFYAADLSHLYLEITAYGLGEREKSWLNEHEKRKKRLSKHIRRKQDSSPVLSSAYLMQKGISPGKNFGELLLAAEKLSVNEDIDDPDLLFLRVVSKA
ncbi:MAG: CCA tRNA nucleotidyltransferase [Chlamydiota bacterium]